jgi:hypothetical protein
VRNCSDINTVTSSDFSRRDLISFRNSSRSSCVKFIPPFLDSSAKCSISSIFSSLKGFPITTEVFSFSFGHFSLLSAEFRKTIHPKYTRKLTKVNSK